VRRGGAGSGGGVGWVPAFGKAFPAPRGGPRRSVYFAFVAAEEQRLLGSEYFVAHPPVPVSKMAADINIDEANWFGRTRDISLIGLGSRRWARTSSRRRGCRAGSSTPISFPTAGAFTAPTSSISPKPECPPPT